MRVLALSDGRMIARDLHDFAAAQFVESGVAHVADGHAAVVDDGDRQHAAHALPLRAQRRAPMDFVVGDGDRFADAIVDRTGLALEPGAKHRDRGVGRLFARGVAAHAVDDEEDAAGRIVVEAVFVLRPLQSGMRVAGRAQQILDRM